MGTRKKYPIENNVGKYICGKIYIRTRGKIYPVNIILYALSGGEFRAEVQDSGGF